MMKPRRSYKKIQRRTQGTFEYRCPEMLKRVGHLAQGYRTPGPGFTPQYSPKKEMLKRIYICKNSQYLQGNDLLYLQGHDLHLFICTTFTGLQFILNPFRPFILPSHSYSLVFSSLALHHPTLSHHPYHHHPPHSFSSVLCLMLGKADSPRSNTWPPCSMSYGWLWFLESEVRKRLGYSFLLPLPALAQSGITLFIPDNHHPGGLSSQPGPTTPSLLIALLA